MVPVLLWLGFWQLQRAEQKRVLRAEYEQALRLPPLLLTEKIDSTGKKRHRQVVATGQYDREHLFLWDNRIHQGRPGYHVITPLMLPESRWVLVNRGWVFWGGSRSVLPKVETPAGEVTVSGRISRPSANPFQLGQGLEGSSGWPRVVQHVNPERLAFLLKQPLFPFVIQQNSGPEDNLVRVWPGPASLNPQIHQAYALQWFLLAVALVGIFLAFSTQRIPVEGEKK